MSEPKLISPLLDGFVMGPPISSHYGVRCCPAMKHNSDNKYIVKIISVPASQAQLEALLLTGAYQNPGDAMDYFKALADGIMEDADLLTKLSQQGGFLSYEGCQIVPMENNNLGYLVYLIGSYKRSLDKSIRRNIDKIQTDAVHMGIDLCAALAACRASGNIYAALKPTNVFLSEDGEYRIGDLGFISLDSLSFTSLPAKYRSTYCPPEVLDPMQILNDTIDTYALGMILYQLFNQGKLPEQIQDSSAAYPAPASADSHLLEVIMKAIDPDPEKRFHNPGEMSKALSACITDDVRTYNPAAKTAAVPVSDTQVFLIDAVSTALNSASQDTKAIPTGETLRESIRAAGTGSFFSDTRVIPTGAITEKRAESTAILSADTRVIPSSVRQAVNEGGQSTIDAAPERETLSQETKIMQPVSSGSSPSDRNASVPQPDYTMEDAYYDDDDDEDDYDEPVRSIPAAPRRKRKKIGYGWIIWLVVAALICGVGYGAYYYYNNYYLQTIDSMTVSGDQDTITVNVVTEIDPSLLTITCTDTYGNSQSTFLTDSEAEFSGLLPNSQYKIAIEIQGFHQLVGKTSDVFNTETRTEIVSFSGIAGSEDGSVMLTITVDGPEPEKWILSYQAEGESEMTTEFTGHSVTVRNLAFPKLYTFSLSPSEDLYVTGKTSMEFSSTALVLAKDLAITACGNGEMTVRWSNPADTIVESWNVRCYSDGGYDQTMETADTKAVFTEIDPNFIYYVEVTASGMTQPARTSITADPITITGLTVDESDATKLTVNWNYTGGAPDGGWLLMYSVDGTNTQSVVKCSGTGAEISPRIHNATYHFTIQAADSTSIFNYAHTYDCPEAPEFKDHSFDPSRTTAYLLLTPEKSGWTDADVSTDDYTDTFKVDDPVSILLICDNRFFIPSEEISILYVIRNEDGQVISNLISQDLKDWHNMWLGHNTNSTELDLPAAPKAPGKYSLSIYFNNMYVTSTDFFISS